MTSSPSAAAFKIIFVLATVFSVDSARAQNIVDRTTREFTANPVRLTDMDVSEFIFKLPRFTGRTTNRESWQIAAKLEAHVGQFLKGAPWMPFHHTLGISGYEIQFRHPDEMFFALALAMPWLSESTAGEVRRLLQRELTASPPYGERGFDYGSGRPRESYDVPKTLRVSGPGAAKSAFGIYAFWAYCQYGHDAQAGAAHWASVRTRAQPLLERDYPWRNTDSAKDDAEKLNGDLAGLIALVRLARLNHDDRTEEQARRRGLELFQLRVNLDRVNPHLVQSSGAATKRLHHHGLTRFEDLVPEVGEALARFTANCAAANLKAFREERNGWFLAFGDRLIGGENYTNPLHFPRAVFAGAALVEQLPAEQLATFVDVPWCKGDFFFIEKCALALWALDGRPWTRL
jgi:hypothetical protein